MGLEGVGLGNVGGGLIGARESLPPPQMRKGEQSSVYYCSFADATSTCPCDPGRTWTTDLAHDRPSSSIAA